GPTGPTGPTGPAGTGATQFGSSTGFAVAGGGATCTMGQVLLTAASIANGVPANGQLLSIGSYSALYSLLGTTYGGDGINNFALPDLRSAAPNNMTYSICDIGIFPSRR
ncbi:MAG: phage tail protein, partial [Mycobacteriales bacterium]